MLQINIWRYLLIDEWNQWPNCLQESENEDDLDERHKYEDEAEESDEDFIDDDEPDESDPDAATMTKSAIAALRNRRSFQESNIQCLLCQDFRVLLRHLLGLEWSTRIPNKIFQDAQ